MRIEELRIGNWLLAKEDNKPCKVISIDNRLTYVNAVNTYTVYSYPLDLSLTSIEDTEKVGFYPIPLSEDVLVKCGFKVLYTLKGVERIKVPIGVYLSVFDMGYKQISIDYSFSNFNTKDYSLELKVVSEGTFNDFKLDIKYLHELQNLYFALTKTELKIEL